MKSFFSLCTLCLFCLTHNLQSQEIKIEQVRPDFYLLSGQGLGSNVGVFESDSSLLIVDTMLPRASEKLLKAIRSISDKRIKYIFNTHTDLDHSGGNELLRDGKTSLVAHENAAYSHVDASWKVGPSSTSMLDGWFCMIWQANSHSLTDLIIRLYKDDTSITFMGDTFTNTWHPTFYTGGAEKQLAAIDIGIKLAKEDGLIVPGHGFITDAEGLKAYKRDFEDWMKRMTELVDQNKTLEQMMADQRLNEIRRNFVKLPGRNIPKQSFQRLIERTLSSDFVKTHPMAVKDFRPYQGGYKNTEGEQVKVIMKEDRLFMVQEKSFMVEILPLSETAFHPRGWLNKSLTFELDDSGKVLGLIRNEGETTIRYRKTF